MRVGLFIFLSIFVLIIVWGIWVRNNIIRYLNASQRAWSDVTNFERQKIKTLDHLEQNLSQYTEFEKSTLENITALRQQILNLNTQSTDVAQLQHIEALSQSLMKSLNVVVENYPDLKADQLYNQMMHDIQEQNENVSAAISIFNRNVEEFNNLIQVFPNNLINSISLAKKPIRPFTDHQAQQNFDYRPNFK